MDQIKLEELAVAYPDQEDLVRFIKSGGFCVFAGTFLSFRQLRARLE